MVEFDSTILPGREGHVTQQVNLGSSTGPITKSVHVLSNASNKPDYELKVKVTVKAIIGLSTRYIRVKAGAEAKDNDKLILTCEKPDLQVKEIVLKMDGAGGGGSWQTDLPTFLKFSMARSEKPNAEGYYEYTLLLTTEAKESKTLSGEFNIKTNHPDRELVTLRGTIEGNKPN